MTQSDEQLERAIAKLKEPVDLPDLTARVMADLREDPAPTPVVIHWWQRRWTVRISPLGGLAAAAGLAGLFLAGRLLERSAPSAEPAVGITASASTAQPTQFILVAPKARSVAVVGDFNDWNISATPLARAAGDGVWFVTVPLEPGRYRYAFIVDGAVWRPDPEAPALEDEFGRPSSVLTIGGA